jgi:hypothetical protein
MSAARSALRTLAFGDLDGTAWGAGWFSDPAAGLTALGAGTEDAVMSSLRLSTGADGDGWRLDGDLAELIVSPAGEEVTVRSDDGQIEGSDQLCRVTGRFKLGGAERLLDCIGVRTWLTTDIDLGRFESIRAVATWFEPGEALALTAFRARKAKAHDGDALTGAVLGPDGSPPVEEPRLSTTYGAEGWPIRAGLELWLAAAEDSEQQFPRRASGEATGPRAQGATADGLELRAEPFRWHSRGRDGAGIYILARRR